eukprot:Gb_41810 [translate_table: standard]
MRRNSTIPWWDDWMKTLESLRNPRQQIPKQKKELEKTEIAECIVEKQKVKEALDSKNDNDWPREDKQNEEEKDGLPKEELEDKKLDEEQTRDGLEKERELGQS